MYWHSIVIKGAGSIFLYTIFCFLLAVVLDKFCFLLEFLSNKFLGISSKQRDNDDE